MAKPEQEEIPMEGKGVASVKDKKLNTLADDFIDKRDEKAKLAEDMTAIESKIIDRMKEIDCTLYRYADREVRIEPGKNHVKIKTVKNEGVSAE